MSAGLASVQLRGQSNQIVQVAAQMGHGRSHQHPQPALVTADGCRRVVAEPDGVVGRGAEGGSARKGVQVDEVVLCGKMDGWTV